MPKFFISYRRSDTQMVAGRLRESLAKRLGERAIFRDKNSIAPGEDWTKAIADALSGGVIVLALIGPTWTTARDDTGRRHVDDPDDWNRIEIERAFERQNRVIPLLVDDAKMPAETELPESLRALARSNALKLRDDDWESDIERLLCSLGVAHDARAWMHRAALTVATVLAILAGGFLYWRLVKAPGTTAHNQRPQLLFPRDNSTISQPYLQAWSFKWDKPADSEGVQQYRLLVFRGSSAYSVIDQLTTRTEYTEASKKCSYIIDQNSKDWRWQVRMQFENGAWSEWSPPWTFDVSTYNKELFCQRCPDSPQCHS